MKKNSIISQLQKKFRRLKRKCKDFYRAKAVIILGTLIAVCIIAAIVLIATLGSQSRKHSSLSREQELMQMVQSKNVIPCHVSSINNFFVMYYGAMATGDTSVLEDSYDDPKNAGISANMSSIVSRITNVKVYVTPGIKKNEVAAFVSYDIYFKNINIPAPSVDSFYIYMNTADSSIKILTRMNTDKDINNFLTLVSYREPVRSLIAETESELYDILNTNTDLRNLYVVMSSMTDENE